MRNGSRSGFKSLTRRGNNAFNRSNKLVFTNEYWSAGIVRDRSAQPSSNVTAHIHETVSIEQLALAKARTMRSDCGSLLAWIFPTITGLANAGYGEERTSFGSNTFDSSAPTFGAGLAIDFQVFDGFLRDRSLQAARAELQAASDQLEQARDETVREVWKNYTDLRTAVRRGAAAAALLKSSQSAYDAVLASFKLGLSTYTDVVTNETKLTSARNSVFETKSAIHQAATGLAYAMGELGNNAKTANTTHRN